jgi:hypothetical protein
MLLQALEQRDQVLLATKTNLIEPTKEEHKKTRW